MEAYRNTIKDEVKIDIEYKLINKDYSHAIEEILIDNIAGFNLFILDIDLKDTHNSIQLAKRIRELDKVSNIIFISSHTELMSLIFVHNLKIVSFIDKMDPNFNQRLFSALDTVKEELYVTNTITNKSMNSDKILQYRYKSRLYRIAYKDIVVIETNAIKRGLVITTTGNTYMCNLSLKKISGILSDDFVQVHRSILVNANKIKELRNRDAQYSVFMETEEEYPVSYKNIRLILEKLNKK